MMDAEERLFYINARRLQGRRVRVGTTRSMYQGELAEVHDHGITLRVESGVKVNIDRLAVTYLMEDVR